MLAPIQRFIDPLRKAAAQQIFGKEEVIDKILAAMLCGGHVQLSDVPGTVKTTLARTLAYALDADFRRIQLTPDMMPADILGVSIPDPKTQAFVFHKGPVFAQIVLADEINRATPRTQSALLECMEEGQVTVDGVTYAVEQPFFVMATQNPVEMQGTFPLPEAQLDRFLLCLSLGYPSREQSLALLAQGGAREATIPVTTVQAWQSAQAVCRTIHVSTAIQTYLVALAEATRTHRDIQLGLSTRGLMTWQAVSQAAAALHGRDYVIPEDVQWLAVDCIAHRLVCRGGGSWTEGTDPCRTLVEEILHTVPVPKETLWKS